MNTLALALGAGVTFFARTIDRDLKHMGAMMLEAPRHHGTSLVEIIQNCIVFNDMVNGDLYESDTKHNSALYVEHGKPLLFGKNREFGLVAENGEFRVVNAASAGNNIAIHDEGNKTQAFMLAQLHRPLAVGVIYRERRHVFEDDILDLETKHIAEMGHGDIAKLISSGTTWEVR